MVKRPTALLLTALLSLPTAARAYCRTTTSGAQNDPTACPMLGTPIAWQRACTALRPDHRVLPTDLTAAAFHQQVVDAAGAWSASLCPGSTLGPNFVMTVLDDVPAPVGYFEGRANVNTVTFRDRWGDDVFHAPEAAAITIVTFSSPSGRILDADTEFNLRGPRNPGGFVFATDGGAEAADLATIITHEFGHTQGLAHSAERSAVMWYSAGRGERRRVPTDDDRAGLCAVYPPSVRAACEPDPGLLTYQGAGLSCAASGRRGHEGAIGWWWVVALAALSRRGPRRRVSWLRER